MPRLNLSLATILSLFGLGVSLMILSPTASSQSGPGLVISEIDYVQAGGDPAEFVELHNTSAESIHLGEFMLVGVRESFVAAGSVIYHREPLYSIDLAPGDYYVVCNLGFKVPNCDQVVDFNGNRWLNDDDGASPKAIAIMKDGGDPENDSLIDSVSYGGDRPGGPLTGGDWTEGSGVVPADTISNTHMGIARLPDGKDTGDNKADFKPRCITPGAKNVLDAERCLPAPSLPDLVINELDYIMGTGTDNAEFLEIYNAGTRSVDLDDYLIWAVSGPTGLGEIYRRLELPPTQLDPGDFYVVCSNAGMVPNCDYAIPQPEKIWKDLFDGGSPNAVTIAKQGYQCGAQNFIDCLDITVDTLSYGAAVLGTSRAGAPWVERSGLTFGDTDQEVRISVSRHPDGADDDENATDFSPTCISPGIANTDAFENCPAAEQSPSLIINELDYNQPGEVDTEEFVELVNISDIPIQLADFYLSGVSENGPNITITLPAALLEPSQRFVVCNIGSFVANCDYEAGTSDNTWHDRYSNQTFQHAVAILRNPVGNLNPNDDMLIDSVSYDVALPGGPPTGGSYLEGSGAVNPGDANGTGEDNISIGRLPDLTDTNANISDFGQACITPGYANIKRVGVIPCNPGIAFTPTPTTDTGVTDTPSPAPSFTPSATPLTPSPSPTSTATATATATDAPPPTVDTSEISLIVDTKNPSADESPGGQ